MKIKNNQKLVKDEFNSTIAHLISRFLKKEGFKSKRINYDKGYSIVVAPPGFKDDDIPPEIITTKYHLRK